MQHQIDLLLELQELEFVLSEAKIVHGGEEKSAAVITKVENLRRQIDAETLARYDRLYKQGMAVVQVRNNICSGCHMAIPQGDLNRMRNSTTEPLCPHCGRFIKI